VVIFPVKDGGPNSCAKYGFICEYGEAIAPTLEFIKVGGTEI